VTFVDPDPDDDLGAGAGPKVYLRGLTASEEIDDVQIQVVHTSAEGVPSEPEMIELTVIAVALSFRPMDPERVPREELSPANEFGEDLDASAIHSGFPLLGFISGFPLLGFIAPGMPPPPSGFRKNMELVATITPCVPAVDQVGFDWELDFKRVRQSPVEGVFDANDQEIPTPGAPKCPPPMWCDDDGDNEDEDLFLDSFPQCTVFSVDTPGIGFLDCGPNEQGHYFIFADSFREWLNAGGFRASETREWHARTQAVCDAGGWMMTGMNLSAEGPLPPAAAQRSRNVPVETDSADPSPDESGERDSMPQQASPPTTAMYSMLPSDEIISRLRDEDARTQMSAFREAERRLRAEEWEPFALEAIIELAKVEREEYKWNDPTFYALRLLGESKTPRATELLLDRIELQTPVLVGRGGIEEAFVQMHPAVDGLLRGCDSSIAPILERSETATDSQWKLMARILHRFDLKTPAVRQAMETLLEVTDDETAKKRLEEFLDTPQPRRPTPPKKQEQTKQTSDESVALGAQ